MLESCTWNDQIAIITGGASGLGFSLAQRLAMLGVKVVLLDVDTSCLQKAEAELGSCCRGFTADICDPAAIKLAVKTVVAEFGRIDILANCAGITGKTGLKSHEVSISDFDRVLAINLRGSFLACHAVLPHMLDRSYGRILNIASIAGKEGNAGMVSYSASKAAVIGMTKSMGKEYAETGITINALAPAVIRTSMVDAMPEAQVRQNTDKIPMKRCGTLQEFSEIAAFIVSPNTSFTTGFTYDLSGGRAVY